MKHLKKMLALVLAICLCIGLMPSTTMAATDTTEYLFFATDRHTNTSIIATMINNMEKNIGEDKLDYLGLGGDMVGSGNDHPEYNSSTVLAEVTGATSSLSAKNVDIVAGIHDMKVNDDAGIVLGYENENGGAQIYEGDRYYVYGVPESCISGAVSGIDPATEANDFVTWANGASIDKSKVIIVLSHYPLHQRRNDNDGAVYWAEALNKVAVGDDTTIDRDVAFFWGHNHTGETSADTAVYHVAPNGSISVQGGSSNQTIYFTYANAGYLNSHSSATLVSITDTTITFDKYKNSSVSTTNTVTRAVTTTLESISVSGTTEYSVGDTLDLTVTATYSDGTTKDVTDDATFTQYDMSVAGNYTVEATYSGKTATYDITVSEIQRTVTDSDDKVLISATSLGLTGIEIENVTGTPDLSNLLEADYITYDVTLTNYTDGEEITYVISLPDEMTTDGRTLYAVAEDGTLTELSYEPGVDEDGFATVTFKTTLTGMFAVGTKIVTIPSDAKLISLEITSEPTVTKYFVATEDDVDDVAVNITGLVVEATYSNGTDTVTKELEWDRFGEITDGYSLTIDPKVIGPQTIKVSYTYGDETYTDEFDITICYQTYTDDTNVQLDFTVASVTAVSVEENSDAEFVVTAMSGYGTNYVSYDINLTGYAQGEKVAVTLPVPEEVKNPVVYYVSDNGNVVNDMNATNNGDGTVSFETDHFSTYVVNDEIETESGNATVEGTEDVTTTTKVAEEVTVYKLVATPVSGKQYLIVNSNTGTGYGLDGDTTGYSTTAFTGGTEYYSSWDNTSKTGTAFAAGNDVYLTTSGAYPWTAGSNGFEIGYNESSRWGTHSYSLDPDNSNSGNWNISDNQLSISLVTQEGWLGSSDTYTTHYISNSGSSWSMSTSGSNVYFYEPVTIYNVTEQEVTIPGDVGHTYSVEGTDITDALAIENQEVTLSSALYDTPEGGTQTDITESSDLTPIYEIVTTKGNPDVIAKDKDGNYLIDGNVATLSGTTGTAVVKVTYTSGDLVAWDEFLVTANAPDHYSIQLHKVELEEATGVTADNFATGTYYVYNSTTGFYSKATEFVDGTTYYVNNAKQGEEITGAIALKGVEKGDTYSVWAVVKAYASADDAEGVDLGALGDSLTWTVSDESIATIDTTTGVITFTGTNYGTFDVTVAYTGADGKVYTDTITISATETLYIVPGDGTNDFPEYPNEGAVRFDKTATAVGNFSETGIAQVELSMTGVPYTTNNAMDVVVMLDMTGSMSDDGMEAAEEATKAFVEEIVKNEDGSYNSNRVAVYAFNSGSSSPYELVALKSITSDSQLETANTAIDTASDKQASGGTPFDEAAKQCYNVLQAAKTNLPDGETTYERQQFCVFMSDGGPTSYEGSDGYTYYGGNNSSGDRAITSYIGGYTSSTSSAWTYNLPTEYYTDQMKEDGVTVYTVGLLLQNAPSNPAPYSSMTDSTYDSTTDSLTSIGSHYYFCSTILKNMATDDSKYIDIFDVDNADNATAKFTSIAQSILEAAKDVVVEDKIGNNYSVNFALPDGITSDATDGVEDFYIQVVEYTLDQTTHERTDTYTILENFTFDGETGELVSHTVDGVECTDCAHVTITGTAITAIDGTYFDYKSDSTGEYLTWTADKLTSTELALQYFAYLDNSAGTDVEDQIPAGTYYTNEYATLTYTNVNGNDVQQEFPVPQMTWNGAQVSYVFYLVNDAGQPVNRAGRVVPFAEAVYVTDVFTYSVLWNDMEQAAGLEAKYLAESIVPDVYALYDDDASYKIHVYEKETEVNLNNHFAIGGDVSDDYNMETNSWTNAKTTYVFNNKSDATKYNDVGTYVADDGDEDVNETEISYFCKSAPIEGATWTSKVENDVTVYTVTSVGNGYQSVSGETQTTVAQITEAGGSTTGGTTIGDYVYYVDENGDVYTIVTKTDGVEVDKGFDFSNTTVAFAVVWKPELVEDTVVVDYGLDVVIDVTTNDALASGVVGVRADAPTGVAINSGTYDAAKGTSVDVKIGDAKIGTATVASLTSVRFSLDKTNGMQFDEPAKFYYESDVNYYKDDVLQTDSMYSSVTVIPATTIYYEDTFVTYTDSTACTSDDNATYGAWSVEGTENTSATQDTDRPGVSKISEDLDADNVYGYDDAYTECTTYSLGSAHKVTVSTAQASDWPKATFTFTGTGFDVISQTSNMTGTITVNVVNADGTYNKTWFVDTYYGYTYTVDSEKPYLKYIFTYCDDGKWHTSGGEAVATMTLADGETTEIPATPKVGDKVVVFEDNGTWEATTNTDNTLYQIPVIKSPELAYDTYTVTITPRYANAFNHVDDDSYDFYLDAIRIYNPAQSSAEANSAYVEDNEAYPSVVEIRDYILAQDTFDTTNTDDVEGAVFIDGYGTSGGISDYTAYGPNNEVYLSAGQAIAFKVTDANGANMAAAHIGVKAPQGGDASILVEELDATTYETIDSVNILTSSATELYYDISECVDLSSGMSKVIVISNNSTESGAMVSLTNLKVTHKSEASETGIALAMSYDDSVAVASVMSARFLASIPVEEVFEPETFTVDVNKTTALVGDTVRVTIQTSSDVALVTVNGNDVTKGRTNNRTGLVSWTYSLKATEAGVLDIEAVAYDADGIASEAIVTNVEVVEVETVVKEIETVVNEIVNQIKNWFTGLFGR